MSPVIVCMKKRRSRKTDSISQTSGDKRSVRSFVQDLHSSPSELLYCEVIYVPFAVGNVTVGPITDNSQGLIKLGPGI